MKSVQLIRMMALVTSMASSSQGMEPADDPRTVFESAHKALIATLPLSGHIKGDPDAYKKQAHLTINQIEHILKDLSITQSSPHLKGLEMREGQNQPLDLSFDSIDQVRIFQDLVECLEKSVDENKNITERASYVKNAQHLINQIKNSIQKSSFKDDGIRMSKLKNSFSQVKKLLRLTSNHALKTDGLKSFLSPAGSLDEEISIIQETPIIQQEAPIIQRAKSLAQSGNIALTPQERWERIRESEPEWAKELKFALGLATPSNYIHQLGRTRKIYGEYAGKYAIVLYALGLGQPIPTDALDVIEALKPQIEAAAEEDKDKDLLPPRHMKNAIDLKNSLNITEGDLDKNPDLVFDFRIYSGKFYNHADKEAQDLADKIRNKWLQHKNTEVPYIKSIVR